MKNYLQYDRVLETFRSEFGCEAVYALPMEAMFDPMGSDARQGLADFVGCDETELESLLADARPQNVRSTRRGYAVKSPRKLTRGGRALQRIWKKTRRPLESVFSYSLVARVRCAAVTRLQTPTLKDFQITDTRRSELTREFSDENRRVAEMFGRRDIWERYGYL